MRATSIRMENFKCYEDAALDLTPGVTVVHGVNGSGKSTLLEAVFFALYGSKALDDRNLADVVTTGADRAEVELGFTHDGDEYRIERRLSRRGERVTTTKCVLEGPDGSVDGARDVRSYVTRLLRMDATAFVNCAYVRQGEVNKLIHASPSERQDMIDDLLQLGALEEYRDRASKARLGVKDVLDEVTGEKTTLDEQIESKREKGLHERLNELETERTEIVENVEHYESQRESAVETKESAREVLETHEEVREEIADIEDDIESLREKIGETEDDREAAKEQIADLEAERTELDERRRELLAEVSLADDQSVDERLAAIEERDEALRDELEDVRVAITETTNSIETHRETADSLESEAEAVRERAEELSGTIEADRETIEERETALEELDEEIESERARFEDAPVEFGAAAEWREDLTEADAELTEEIGDVSAEHKAVASAIEDAEALLDAGQCPECGQPVDEAPHVTGIETRREERAALKARLEDLREEREAIQDRIDRAEALLDAERTVERLRDKRENVSQLLEEKRDAIAERERQYEELLEEIEECETEAAEHRDRATEQEAEVNARRETLGTVNEKRAALREEREVLTEIREVEAEREECTREIETLRERRADWETMNDERRSQLSAKRDRLAELEASFDEDRLAEAGDDLERATDYIDQVDEKLSELRERRDDLQSAIGAVENELEELEALENRRDAVEDRLAELQALHDEAETLQETYGTLRTDLRQRNVETLERMVNETFDLLYQNDTYAGIDLDGSYQLTVYQKDGEALDPEQLSGGERALFNLSLRCAIYRLLAEGVEGAAPLPPLILDEPTVFLDSGHVSQLITLVESMRDLGVEQILLVSHDEELVGAADELVHVRTDATTNRSTLARSEGIDPAQILAETS